MKKLLKINVCLTFLLIVWGGLVRSSGSGLACPDWPLCHGEIIPPFELPVLIEWGHRLLASSVSFFTLIITFSIFVNKKYRSVLSRLAILAILLLGFQVALGALTVRHLLGAHIVTTHLGTALLFLGTQILISLSLGRGIKGEGSVHSSAISPHPDPLPQEREKSRSPLQWLTIFIGVLLYVQILLGGWVASSHAGLACPDFPTCFGAWVPPLVGLVKYQFLHRVGALLVFLAVISLIVFAWRYPLPEKAKRMLRVVFWITFAQVLLGISNVVFQLPIGVRVAHLALATALYSMLIVTAHEVKSGSLS
jgi:cytochrome c oxidase assembly protein subunit 15